MTTTENSASDEIRVKISSSEAVAEMPPDLPDLAILGVSGDLEGEAAVQLLRRLGNGVRAGSLRQRHPDRGEVWSVKLGPITIRLSVEPAKQGVVAKLAKRKKRLVVRDAVTSHGRSAPIAAFASQLTRQGLELLDSDPSAARKCFVDSLEFFGSAVGDGNDLHHPLGANGNNFLAWRGLSILDGREGNEEASLRSLRKAMVRSWRCQMTFAGGRLSKLEVPVTPDQALRFVQMTLRAAYEAFDSLAQECGASFSPVVTFGDKSAVTQEFQQSDQAAKLWLKGPGREVAESHATAKIIAAAISRHSTNLMPLVAVVSETPWYDYRRSAEDRSLHFEYLPLMFLTTALAAEIARGTVAGLTDPHFLALLRLEEDRELRMEAESTLRAQAAELLA